MGASAASWREALESLLRYSKLVNGAANFCLEIEDGRARVVLDSSVPLSRECRDEGLVDRMTLATGLEQVQLIAEVRRAAGSPRPR